MPNKNIRFNGVNVAWVTVSQACYTQAEVAIGTAPTDSAGRERMAVAKLREANIVCAAALHPSYDARVTVAGVVYNADIKSLFRTYGVANDNSRAAQADIWSIIDHEHEKEEGQGAVCLFDLSYLHADLRDGVIGGIHNTYPDAMTLWYTHDGRDVHFCYPGKGEVHTHV